MTSRRELSWEKKGHYAIPTEYIDTLTIGHFSDVDAHEYLKKAGVNDTALRARLCDYARVEPYEVHPLYAGLGADVVLQASRRGRKLTVEDFPVEPDAKEKPKLLVERLLTEASEDVEYAARSLAAARAFDRELFEKLGSWGRSRYSATDAAFDTLTQFSFVWEAETRGAGWYSVHALLRRILRERGDDRLREADGALEAIYRERAEASYTLALAEVVYHAYQQEPERGLQEWLDVFEEARVHSQYALCEALRTVGAEVQVEDPWWRGEIARQEGEYLSVRSRYAEADEALQASVSALDEALSRAPDYIEAYNNKGRALRARGDLLVGLARYEEAERAYADAVASLDEALKRTPDHPYAYNTKGNALQGLGGLLESLARYEEAERAYADAVASLDEALRRTPDHPEVYNNKGNALQGLGGLLMRLARYEEAERAYADAVAAYDEALSRAPDQPQAYNNKGVALGARGELLAELSSYEEAERAYADAVASLDEALSRAPDYIEAYNNKGRALRAHGDLLVRLARYEEAERAYADAVASLDEALRRTPDHPEVYKNKGKALQGLGGLLVRLARYEEAERTHADAIAAFDEALSRVPDYSVHNDLALAFLQWGVYMRPFMQTEVTRARLEAAQAHCEHVLTLAPQLEQAEQLLAFISEQLDRLDADASKEE